VRWPDWAPPLATASAVPEHLSDYARTTVRLADELGGAARRLAAVLAEFAATHPTVGAPDTTLAGAVARHAVAAGSLGAWVGRVADAFRRADGGTTRRGHAPVTVVEPVLESALARRATALRRLVPGDPDEWDRTVNGAVCRAGGIRGGGFLMGPDGRRYPVVVPEGGERHDPRWRVVAVEDGLADMRERTGWGMRLLLGLGASALGANGQRLGARPAAPEAYADLVTPPVGTIHGAGRARVARPGRPVPPAPPEAPEPVRPGAARADDTVAMPRVVGLASVAATAAAAARGVRAIEDQNVVATRVTYEVDDSGRRRAVVKVWQITEDDGGERRVGESYAWLGRDGKVALEAVPRPGGRP
jgi:hypothetical protein